MDILHPASQEMVTALLAAAEAERWNHWQHELRAHTRDWVKAGDARRPLRAEEFAGLPKAVALYPFVELCVYGYRDRVVWGFYARKLPFREWVLTNVLVVYDPAATEIIHCMWPRRKKRYCGRWGAQTHLFVRVWGGEMYAYEPDFEDPKEELEVCMNFYRDLARQLHFWDLMEFVNYLSARDGVEWALERLGRENVEPAVLAEIEELDAKLRANADYLVDKLELYKHIWRDEPEEHWWWYLDGGKPDGPLEAKEVIGEMWKPIQAASATVVEERASHEAQSRDE